MSRMSAKFVAQKVGMSVKWVYDMWNNMGLITKDKFGDWVLTELGKQHGGKMSNSNRVSVPTFKFETIEKMMIEFYNKNK